MKWSRNWRKMYKTVTEDLKCIKQNRYASIEFQFWWTMLQSSELMCLVPAWWIQPVTCLFF
jgi:hypothetical protein